MGDLATIKAANYEKKKNTFLLLHNERRLGAFYHDHICSPCYCHIHCGLGCIFLWVTLVNIAPSAYYCHMAKTLNRLAAIVTIAAEEKIGSIGLIAPVSKTLNYKKGRIEIVSDDFTQPAKVGDVVLYYKHSIQSADIRIDDKTFDLVSEAGIMCVL